MPSRRKKPSQWMSIYFPDPDLKEQVFLLAKHRSTTASALVRKLCREEIKRAT